MRCLSCDKNLNDKESTRKSIVTGEYLDLCDPCFSTISDEVQTVVNPKHVEPPEVLEEC